MKNKLLLLAMGFALTTQMVMAQVPSYVPTNGLVGYWPFNGNANDISPNANNGTNNGATLTIDRFGVINSAYFFNGIDNYIQLPFSTNSNTFSISTWIKFPSNTSTLERAIIGNDDENFSAKTVWLTSDNKIAIHNCHPSPQECIDLTSTTILEDNQWKHIVCSVNNGFVTYYINGIQSNTIFGVETFGINWRIGVKGTSINQVPYLGEIDDIGIWNRALTQDEVTSLYYAENTCQSLVINTGVLSFNPPTYNNTVTIFPNPANDHITIDCGNLANVSGWTIKIVNTLGQEVFSGAMNTQQYVVPLNSWSGQGVYFVKIYDGSNNLVNTKKIILQ
jgi:hypothetical protein